MAGSEGRVGSWKRGGGFVEGGLAELGGVLRENEEDMGSTGSVWSP